jgi:hypothetical protein
MENNCCLILTKLDDYSLSKRILQYILDMQIRKLGNSNPKPMRIESHKEILCAYCAGMNELLFKECVYGVGYLKCDEENVTFHNIPSWFQCQHCEHFNNVYCCTDSSHRTIAECSVCGKVEEITYSRTSFSTSSTILYCAGCQPFFLP